MKLFSLHLLQPVCRLIIINQPPPSKKRRKTKKEWEELIKGEKDYDSYNDYGCGYVHKFVENNPEFNSDEFIDFVIQKNKGDRDSGEVGDVAEHEVLRLAKEFKTKG